MRFCDAMEQGYHGFSPCTAERAWQSSPSPGPLPLPHRWEEG